MGKEKTESSAFEIFLEKKKQKNQDEIRVCDSYLTGAEKHNAAKREEESQNRDRT